MDHIEKSTVVPIMPQQRLLCCPVQWNTIGKEIEWSNATGMLAKIGMFLSYHDDTRHIKGILYMLKSLFFLIATHPDKKPFYITTYKGMTS